MSEMEWARAMLTMWQVRCGARRRDERGAIDNIVWYAGAAGIAAVAIAIILVKVRAAANHIDLTNPVPTGGASTP